MEMLIGGRWQPAASGRTEEVTSPFARATLGTAPVADAGDVRAALDRAEAGAVTLRRTPAFERMSILIRAAALTGERARQATAAISPAARAAPASVLHRGGRAGWGAVRGHRPRQAPGRRAGDRPAGPQGLVHRVDGPRAAHHPDRRDQEAAPGARLVVPGRGAAGRGH